MYGTDMHHIPQLLVQTLASLAKVIATWNYAAIFSPVATKPNEIVATPWIGNSQNSGSGTKQAQQH